MLVPVARARVPRGDRPRRSAAAAGRASAASTCRRSTSRSTRPTARWPGTRVAGRRTRRCRCGRRRVQDDRRARSAGDEHLHARHRVRIALPRRSRPRLREPVPLLLGRLQLPAGPPVSRPTGSCSSPKRRASHASRVGLVSIALCDHPDIERILARLLEMGYAHQPGVAAARRSDRADRPGAARRAASAASRLRRRPARIGCAA